MAARFIDWLGVPAGAAWLDVGTGTGALLEAIQASASPKVIAGADPSETFLAVAAGRLPETTQLVAADAEHLPFEAHSFDATVSGLALNFMPDAVAALSGMRRVTRPGGVVAAYVWDYAEGMQFLRRFWDVATELDPSAAASDEGRRRFPLCRPAPLRAAFEAAALSNVETAAIEIATPFDSFDDYWNPFLAGQGPAGTYVTGLPPSARDALAERLRPQLTGADGRVDLTARAWAVRGEATVA